MPEAVSSYQRLRTFLLSTMQTQHFYLPGLSAPETDWLR